jgi:hypothetical protein
MGKIKMLFKMIQSKPRHENMPSSKVSFEAVDEISRLKTSKEL